MPDLYPLRFQPLFRQYVWGGRRLESVLGKRLGPGPNFAESWEIVDRDQDQSIVAFGPRRGSSLRDIVRQEPAALFGQNRQLTSFPLLFKFLDAQRALSVQVHPNDAQAAKQNPPDLGKTEAWVILATEPQSRIYAGLKPGIDRLQLQGAITTGRVESCLHQFTPRVGDCVFIPAGTVHALGAGLLIAEIQQASDTTFRLFDWNRVDANGAARPLHTAESLQTIDYLRGPVSAQQSQSIKIPGLEQPQERLVECDKFVLNRLQLGGKHCLSGIDSFQLLVVVQGQMRVANDPAPLPLVTGELMLLPAEMNEIDLEATPGTVCLQIFLPEKPQHLVQAIFT